MAARAVLPVYLRPARQRGSLRRGALERHARARRQRPGEGPHADVERVGARGGVHQPDEGVDLADGLGTGVGREQLRAPARLGEKEPGFADFRLGDHPAVLHANAVFLRGELSRGRDPADYPDLVSVGLRLLAEEGNRHEKSSAGTDENHFQPIWTVVSKN
jgi:hypothetical protein